MMPETDLFTGPVKWLAAKRMAVYLVVGFVMIF
jgi:hypothetical protein